VTAPSLRNATGSLRSPVADCLMARQQTPGIRPTQTRMRLFALLLLVGVTACRDGAQSDSASVRIELDQFNSRFDSLYRAGDAAAIAQQLTDSAVISPIETPDLGGRAVIQPLLAGFFGGNHVTQYALHVNELDVAGRVAFARGTFVWTSGPRGGAVQSRRGRFAAVYHRDTVGTWRLHRLIENLLPPPSP
jgi:ketosteroid isomerase-like protein